MLQNVNRKIESHSLEHDLSKIYKNFRYTNPSVGRKKKKL